MQAIVLRCMKHLTNSGSFKTAARSDAHVYSLFPDESFVIVEFFYSYNYAECEYHHLVAFNRKILLLFAPSLFCANCRFQNMISTIRSIHLTLTINSLYVSGMIETILLGSSTYKTKNINNDSLCSENLCTVMLRIAHLFLYHYVKSSFFLSTS